jgi:hypothetical protein
MTCPLTTEECFGFDYSAVSTVHFHEDRHGGGTGLPDRGWLMSAWNLT